MINKKKLSVFILIGFIFTIVYVLAAVKSLTKEYQFIPEWKINITSAGTTNNFAKNETETLSDDDAFYFKLGQTLGYFTENGKINLYQTFPAKASISDSYYAFYNSDAKKTVFYNNEGKEVSNMSEDGFPFFDENRIYVFLPGGCSFVKCDSKGQRMWIHEGIIPITAFSTNENFTAVGFADGNIKIFENITGSIEINYEPGGSDYPIIYGIAISSDGQYVASVSGREKQRFVIAKKEKNQPKIIFHDFLDSDITQRTLVHFSKDDKKVLYNYGNKLGIFDFDKNSKTTINLESPIISVEESETLFFLLGKKNKKYTVYSVEKTDSLQGKFSFEADSAFIKTHDDSLFVGKNNTISKLRITKD